MRKTFFILSYILLILILPIFALSKSDYCFTNELCFYEMGNCTNGLFIGLNEKGAPLEIPVIENVPPTKINFTPKSGGEIKIIKICFNPFNVEKKYIEIKEKSMLSYPLVCEVNNSYTLNISDCDNGLLVIINKKNSPIDYNLYSPINSISSSPYSYTFKPKEEGTIRIIGICFSPQLKVEKANIEIKKKVLTCSQLGGTCCPSGQSCTQSKIFGAPDCLECCANLSFCRVSTCGDGICEEDENCPADSSACTHRICREASCVMGCQYLDLDSGSQDEGYCDDSKGCVTPPCTCKKGNCISAEELVLSNCILDKSKWSITCDSNCKYVEGRETYFMVIDKNRNMAQARNGGATDLGLIYYLAQNKIKVFSHPSLSLLDSDTSQWIVYLRCWNPDGHEWNHEGVLGG